MNRIRKILLMCCNSSIVVFDSNLNIKTGSDCTEAQTASTGKKVNYVFRLAHQSN